MPFTDLRGVLDTWNTKPHAPIFVGQMFNENKFENFIENITFYLLVGRCRCRCDSHPFPTANQKVNMVGSIVLHSAVDLRFIIYLFVLVSYFVSICTTDNFEKK